MTRRPISRDGSKHNRRPRRLTPDQVRRIRTDHANGRPLDQIAASVSLHPRSVLEVVLRQSYAWVL